MVIEHPGLTESGVTTAAMGHGNLSLRQDLQKDLHSCDIF